jgi:hypothetical protein
VSAGGEGGGGGSDASADAPSITTIISPYDPSGTLAYAFGIDWTIASDPPAMIYAMSNGTNPDMTSPHGMSPYTVSSPAGVIKWIVGNDPTVHTFSPRVDTNLQSQTQAFATGFTFDSSKSPIVHASPGSVLMGTASAAQEWMIGSATGDIEQVVIGINSSSACLMSGIPGAYPGSEQSPVQFTLTAPTAAGTYSVHVGHTLQTSCVNANGHVLDATVVGVIIVP